MEIQPFHGSCCVATTSYHVRVEFPLLFVAHHLYHINAIQFIAVKNEQFIVLIPENEFLRKSGKAGSARTDRCGRPPLPLRRKRPADTAFRPGRWIPLRRPGFERAYDTNSKADLTIMEEATALLHTGYKARKPFRIEEKG